MIDNTMDESSQGLRTKRDGMNNLKFESSKLEKWRVWFGQEQRNERKDDNFVRVKRKGF